VGKRTRLTTPKERRKKERNKSKLSLYNHEDALKVLGKINQRLPFLSAIFLAVIFQTLCFAESIQGVGSGEGAHYFEYNQSRSINARHYGLIPDSSIDQSSMLVRAIKYASENKEIDCVYVPEGTYQFTQSIWLKAGVSLIGAGPGKTVFTGKNPKAFLIRAKRVDFGDAVVANMTVSNLERALLITNSRNLSFQNVEFKGGMVRFEKSENVTFEGNIFNDNLGKGGYAGSGCKNIRIVKNTFNSIENGSINLSGHQNSYVANNHITASKLIDSGYAGIRLPNGARNNVVENNFIQNHGRGLFILSSSKNNIVRNNTVKSTMYQGVLIQSSNNLLEENTIIDAGMEAIYVTDANAENSPTPSVANGNRILENIIYDTKSLRSSRCIGLKIGSRANLIKGNRVSMNHGRDFKSIRLDSGNEDENNLYVKSTKLDFAGELDTPAKK
jgi:parallel beta-helix repeat protein